MEVTTTSTNSQGIGTGDVGQTGNKNAILSQSKNTHLERRETWKNVPVIIFWNKAKT